MKELQMIAQCRNSINFKDHLFQKVSSLAVPLYYPQENERKPVDITPFAEVCVEGHTFMIRKPTAIWVFRKAKESLLIIFFELETDNLCYFNIKATGHSQLHNG